jgi:hypothetical protein
MLSFLATHLDAVLDFWRGAVASGEVFVLSSAALLASVGRG